MEIPLRFVVVLYLSFAVSSDAIAGAAAKGGLIQNFYLYNNCPQAEHIIRNLTWTKAQSDPLLGSKLLRVQFHDCFVRGCDGSLLLDTAGSTPSEKDAIPNRNLARFEVIDFIKAQLELACPAIVSCSDILALATRDAVSFPFRLPMWNVLTGRRDGRVSLLSEVAGNVPSLASNFTTLQELFNRKGLSINDLVSLSGSHTIGVGHCTLFANRLYNFTGNGDMDPSLDRKYAESLKLLCPNPQNPNTTVEMDPRSSLSFDAHYFTTVKQNKGLFPSDAALLNNPASAKLVGQLQSNAKFYLAFAKSMVKMANVQVLTGTDGEIRKNCRVVNSISSI